VVANLPYSIASPLLIELTTAGVASRYVVMVQREVADRIVAAPGSRTYGLLSVVLQAGTVPSIVTRVPRTAFFPPPHVGSAVVRLERPAVPPVPRPLLPSVIALARLAFGQRRKMLRSSLRAAGRRPRAGPVPIRLGADEVERLCAAAGIDSMRRGESLSVREFRALAEALAAVGPAPAAVGPAPAAVGPAPDPGDPALGI